MIPTRRLLPLALLLFAATALGDELRWRSLDVEAKIDDDGTLHASERHTMIFDGEWNGGQRTIPLRVDPPPQGLTFDRVARVVSKKKTIDLTRVSDAPDQVDEYGVYNDGTTIRWRARLADDPPFRGRRITYIIDYTLTNALIRRGAPLRLDYDFTPTDRPGPIEHFSLIVELPKSLNQPPIKIARDNIPPGEGVLVRETYWLPKGARAPAALAPAAAAPPAPAPPKKEPSPTKTPITPFTAHVIVFALIVLALLFVFRFFFGEAAAGRFARVPGDQRDWIDDFLSKLDAEVVGVAWDDVVGQDEVAAILARMTAEGKIKSSVEKGDMILKLEVPFDTLRGYEADLIQALFLGKSEATTRAVREHYAASGFDPARVVGDSVKRALLGLPQWEDQKRSEWVVFWILAALTFVLAIAGGSRSEVDAGMAFMFGFLAVIAGGLALLFTIGAKRALTAVPVRFCFGLFVPFFSIVIAAVAIVQGPTIPHPSPHRADARLRDADRGGPGRRAHEDRSDPAEGRVPQEPHGRARMAEGAGFDRGRADSRPLDSVPLRAPPGGSILVARAARSAAARLLAGSAVLRHRAAAVIVDAVGRVRNGARSGAHARCAAAHRARARGGTRAHVVHELMGIEQQRI